MRRAHRSRRFDGERYSRLPLCERDLGRRRSLRGRVDPGVQTRPGTGVGVLRGADPHVARRRAEPGPSRARRARAARPRRRCRHPEHRHAPLTGREPGGRRGARLDPLGGVSPLPVDRRSGRRPRTARAASCSGLRPVRRDPEARRHPLRRAASRCRHRARHGARTLGGAHARRGVVARGLAGRRAPSRGAGVRDRQPRARPRSTITRCSSWTREPATRSSRSSTRSTSRASSRSVSCIASRGR